MVDDQHFDRGVERGEFQAELFANRGQHHAGKVGPFAAGGQVGRQIECKVVSAWQPGPIDDLRFHRIRQVVGELSHSGRFPLSVEFRLRLLQALAISL